MKWFVTASFWPSLRVREAVCPPLALRPLAASSKNRKNISMGVLWISLGILWIPIGFLRIPLHLLHENTGSLRWFVQVVR